MSTKKDKGAQVESLPNSVFNRLSQIDVGEKTEQKNGLTYLSWAWAFAEIFKRYPDASYSVKEHVNTYVVDTEDGRPAVTYSAVEPFLFNYHLGYLVTTSVTIEGITKTMQLPVMDGANKAQKHVQYTYPGWEYVKKPGAARAERVKVEKVVEPATMFDINTTIMRCLVKNFAMHGLGHYIYAGEDLPEDISKMIAEEVKATPEKATTPEPEVKETPVKGAVVKKTTKKAETTPKVERPAEMPDDSAVLPSQPLAESEVDAKKSFTAVAEAKLKAATNHEEIFEVLKSMDEAKALVTGTMNFGWKFKNFQEVIDAMSKGPLDSVRDRLIQLVNLYNPNK